MKTICFTGHRPNKLGGYDYNNETNYKIQRLFETAIVGYIKEGYTHFICGGALGIDQMAFAVCNYLRKTYPITIELALPYEDMETAWFTDSSKEFHYKSMTLADKTTMVDAIPHYNKEGYVGFEAWKLQKRNEYMVDKADLVVAFWNSSAGGTKNCVDYARQQEKPMVNLFRLLQTKDTLEKFLD